MDDDGSFKNIVPQGDALFNSLNLDACPNAEGLHVTAFHLADRNEGGLFGGKFEVYLSATLYNSGDPVNTYKTNERSAEFEDITILGATVRYYVGMALDEVPASAVSSTVQTIRTRPNDRSWTILNSGMCNHPQAYDRVRITIFERDGQRTYWEYGGWSEMPVGTISRGDFHFARATQNSDDWFTTKNAPAITLQDFINAGGRLFLTETPGGYSVQNVQPGPERSWFKIELY